MNTITLYEALKASTYIMAKKDVRHFLNGVHIVKKDGIVTVESSNGHMVFRTRAVDPSNVTCEELDVIVSGESINLALKLGKDLHMDDEGFNGGAIKYEKIDGKFPDVERVIPKIGSFDYTSEPFCVNLDYMGIIAKSIKAIDGNKNPGGRVHVSKSEINVTGPLVIECEKPDTVWVLMPMRGLS